MKFDNWREKDLYRIAEVCDCKYEGKFVFRNKTKERTTKMEKKTKTVYERKLYSVQIGKDELKAALREGREQGRCMEYVLRSLCTKDIKPKSYGFAESKEAAAKLLGDQLIIDFLDKFTCAITCAMTEIYRVYSANNEFCDGSDYDYDYCFDAEAEKTVASRLRL